MSPRVKICGLRTAAALEAALEAGADLVGFVLYPKSPRNVSLAEAATLVRQGRGRAQTVTLLVDPDDALVDRVAAEIGPDLIQLHGHETPERVLEIGSRSGIPILKAVPVATAGEVEAAFPYLAPRGGANLLMFDAKPPPDPAALPGGNGLAFDWHILEAARGRDFALAGGLTPETVAAAIRLTGASLVDVSSGVESRPGEKNPELIRRFLQAAKAAKQS